MICCSMSVLCSATAGDESAAREGKIEARTGKEGRKGSGRFVDSSGVGPQFGGVKRHLLIELIRDSRKRSLASQRRDGVFEDRMAVVFSRTKSDRMSGWDATESLNLQTTKRVLVAETTPGHWTDTSA